MLKTFKALHATEWGQRVAKASGEHTLAYIVRCMKSKRFHVTIEFKDIPCYVKEKVRDGYWQMVYRQKDDDVVCYLDYFDDLKSCIELANKMEWPYSISSHVELKAGSKPKIYYCYKELPNSQGWWFEKTSYLPPNHKWGVKYINESLLEVHGNHTRTPNSGTWVKVQYPD